LVKVIVVSLTQENEVEIAMRREELTGHLRQEYDERRGYGVSKVDDPEYQNIWFVVPLPPPRELPPNPPLAAMGRAHATLSRLPSFTDMTEVDKLINYFFVRKEAVESSRMEGTWSTIDNVLTPSEVYEAGDGKSEHHSVRGYAHALEKQFNKALEQKERVFTEEVLCEIHRDIVSKDPSFKGEPGALREPGKPRSVVQIGRTPRKEDSTYNPTPPQYVKASLRRVLDWVSDEELAQRGDAGVAGFTLAVRLAVGHAHFEAVHPFSDGNGRVGRALWPLQMICADRMPLYLSGYVEDQKDAYSRALQEAQKKLDYSPIIEFICEAVVQSEVESKITRAVIEGLPSKWRDRAKFRSGSASLLALDVLQKRPIITSTILMDELKLSKQALNTAINQLVERHIIRPRGKIGRTHVYAAEELIALLSRRFGTSAEEALDAGYQAILKQEPSTPSEKEI
jgi:Fic family protein